MEWLRSEEEVDEMIEDMVNRTNGRYITQGVAFNKSCPRQMGLLKKALMSSVSFSSLGKEMLAIRFSERSGGIEGDRGYDQNSLPPIQPIRESKVKNTGNFT